MQRLQRIPVYPDEAEPVSRSRVHAIGSADFVALQQGMTAVRGEVAVLARIARLAYRLDMLALLEETGRLPLQRLAPVTADTVTTSYAVLWTNVRRRPVKFICQVDWAFAGATSGALLRFSRSTAETGWLDTLRNAGNGTSGAVSALLRVGESVYVRDGEGTATPGATDVLRLGIADYEPYMADNEWPEGSGHDPAGRAP